MRTIRAAGDGSAVSTPRPTPSGSSSFEVLWAVDGPVTTGVSNRYFHRGDITLTRVFVTLGTAGTTDTVIQVRKNGSTVVFTTSVLAGGYTTDASPPDVEWVEGDVMTVAVTAAGGGAQYLQVQLGFD